MLAESFETIGLAKLATVIDPELGVDLVSLGLIYGVTTDTQGHCVVTMTLTMMGCPLTAVLSERITAAMITIAGVTTVTIDLVWEPAWSIARMSRVARLTLGV